MLRRLFSRKEQRDLPQTLFFNSVVVIPIVCCRQRLFALSRGGGSTVIVCRSSSARCHRWSLLDGPVRDLRSPQCCNPARFQKRCILDGPVRALSLSWTSWRIVDSEFLCILVVRRCGVSDASCCGSGISAMTLRRPLKPAVAAEAVGKRKGVAASVADCCGSGSACGTVTVPCEHNLAQFPRAVCRGRWYCHVSTVLGNSASFALCS